MDQETIEQVISVMKRSLTESGVAVERLVVFGSHATGTARDDSDLDLIIVSGDFQDKDLFERCAMTLEAELATRKRFTLPMDILTMTPAEFGESITKRSFPTRTIA